MSIDIHVCFLRIEYPSVNHRIFRINQYRSIKGLSGVRTQSYSPEIVLLRPVSPKRIRASPTVESSAITFPGPTL